MNFFLYLPTLLLWGYVDMDMGVGSTVSLLGKKIEVDQDKEDWNGHNTCNGLLFVTAFVIWQLKIIIEFPIKVYVHWFYASYIAMEEEKKAINEGH